MILKNNKNSLYHIFIILLIFIVVHYSKEIIPIESKFVKALCIYGILLFITLISSKLLLSDGFKIYGLNVKIKTSIKLYAIIIGLIIGASANIIVFYTIDSTNYLKDYNFLEVIILAVIVGPVVEEIIFRGYIQTFISKKITNKKCPGGFWLTIIITALLFGLLHINAMGAVGLSQTIAIMLTAFVLGITTSYFKEKYKSIVPSMYMHMATNLSSFIMLPILFILLLVNEEKYDIHRHMDKPEYNFDLGDSIAFRNSLIKYSVYEKIKPDSAIGKPLNITITMLLTVDTAGVIVKTELDTTNGWYKIRNDIYEKNALIIANKMPKWKVPKNMKKDSTVRFIVSY